jgi:sarcosine oxidase gamma subunit
MVDEGETAYIMSILGKDESREVRGESAAAAAAAAAAVAAPDALHDKAVDEHATWWFHPGDMTVFTNGGEREKTHH